MTHKRGRITGKIVSKTHNRFKDDALRFILMGGPRNRCDSDISVDPVLETVGSKQGKCDPWESQRSPHSLSAGELVSMASSRAFYQRNWQDVMNAVCIET